MKKLNILYVSEFFPPNIKGGAEISTKFLVDEISKSSNCVVVTSKFDKLYTNKNYCVYSILKRCNCEGSLLRKLSYGINILFSPIYNYFKIKKLVKKENLDLIQIVPTHFTYFRLISLLTKLDKPIVIDIRDYSFNSPFGINSKDSSPVTLLQRAISKRNFFSKILFLLIGFYELALFKIYTMELKLLNNRHGKIKFVAISHFIKNKLIESGYPREKIEVIPNISEHIKIKLKILKKENKIIFAGRIEEEKGIWDAIKAFELINDKNLTFEIVGEGSESENIRKYLTKNKIKNIKLFGKILNNKVLDLYSKSKIILGPSVWPEPFGRFIQESISTKTACIATNVGGIPEGIKHRKTGLLVEPNNPKQLAKAIKLLLSNEKLYNRIVKNLEKEQKKYSPEIIGKQRLKLYEKVINKNSKIFK